MSKPIFHKVTSEDAVRLGRVTDKIIDLLREEELSQLDKRIVLHCLLESHKDACKQYGVFIEVA